MATHPTKQATLDADAHAALLQLQVALGGQHLPRSVDLKDILSALAMYTTAAPAAGMLHAYWEYIDERERARAARRVHGG
jgi:hypothetical protein